MMPVLDARSSRPIARNSAMGPSRSASKSREVVVVHRLDEERSRSRRDRGSDRTAPASRGVRVDPEPRPRRPGRRPRPRIHEHRDRDHEQSEVAGHRVMLHAGSPGGGRHSASDMKTLRGPFWPSERRDFMADSGIQGAHAHGATPEADLTGVHHDVVVHHEAHGVAPGRKHLGELAFHRDSARRTPRREPPAGCR